MPAIANRTVEVWENGEIIGRIWETRRGDYLISSPYCNRGKETVHTGTHREIVGYDDVEQARTALIQAYWGDGKPCGI